MKITSTVKKSSHYVKGGKSPIWWKRPTHCSLELCALSSHLSGLLHDFCSEKQADVQYVRAEFRYLTQRWQLDNTKKTLFESLILISFSEQACICGTKAVGRDFMYSMIHTKMKSQIYITLGFEIKLIANFKCNIDAQNTWNIFFWSNFQYFLRHKLIFYYF